MRDHYAFWNFWLTIGALVPTAALLCLVLVTDDFARGALHVTPDELRLINAGVALFTFICVLVQLVWKPDSREAAHAFAVVHYSDSCRAASISEASEMGRAELALLSGREHGTRAMPPIRYAALVRLKQVHLQTMQLNCLLSDDPWMALPRGHRWKRFRSTIRASIPKTN
jgi:hypothetical protein